MAAALPRADDAHLAANVETTEVCTWPSTRSGTFKPINIALLTVSDTRGPEEDTSGDILAERIKKAGHHLAARAIEQDDAAAIAARLNNWIDDHEVDAVVITGGTGLTGRDVTPEALDRVKDKDIPGFGEMFRWISYKTIGTSTVQSPRLRRGRARNLYLRPARLQRRSEGRLGRHPRRTARQPQPALQFRRTDAAAQGSLSGGLTGPHSTHKSAVALEPGRKFFRLPVDPGCATNAEASSASRHRQCQHYSDRSQLDAIILVEFLPQDA